MKKIIYSFLSIFLIFTTSLVYKTGVVNANEIKDGLMNATNPGSGINDDNGLSMLSRLLTLIKSEFMAIVSIFAIGVFIFIGFKFVMARGNPEEFKKAMSHLIYAVIGVFFIFIAWGLVKLVSTLSL